MKIFLKFMRKSAAKRTKQNLKAFQANFAHCENKLQAARNKIHELKFSGKFALIFANSRNDAKNRKTQI